MYKPKPSCEEFHDCPSLANLPTLDVSPVAAEPVRSGDTTSEELLKKEHVKIHTAIIFTNLDDLISELYESDKLSDRLFNLQITHRNMNIKVRKYVTKQEFREFMMALDLTIEANLPKQYKGKSKRAFRHFLEIVYYMITYYMPKRCLIEGEFVDAE